MESILVSRPSSLSLRDYPHVLPPPKSIPFNRVGFETIDPGESFDVAPDRQNIIKIPVLQKGWISQLAVYLASYGAGQTWSLTENGVAKRDYTNVKVPLGAVETPVIRHIELSPNQAVALTFFNGSGEPLSFGWSMYGWYYPAK